MQREYEIMVVLHPDVTGELIDERISALGELLRQHGNTVSEIIDWGRRRLAYPIRRAYEGHYLIAHYSADTDSPADGVALERALAIDDQVLRHLIVRRDD